MPLCIPNFYRPPLGLPLYWHDEVSGILRIAVHAYLEHRISAHKPAPDSEQFALLKSYVIHHINAPCWDAVCEGVFEKALAALRRDAALLETSDDIAAYINQAMEIGLDPL